MATLHHCLSVLALPFKSIPKLIKPSFRALVEDSAEPADAAECPVCLMEIGEGEKVSRKLKCKHVFHKCCFDAWVEEHRGRTCPVCRDMLSVHGKRSEAEAEEDDGGWRGESTIVFSPFSGFSQEDSWWLR